MPKIPTVESGSSSPATRPTMMSSYAPGRLGSAEISSVKQFNPVGIPDTSSSIAAKADAVGQTMASIGRAANSIGNAILTKVQYDEGMWVEQSYSEIKKYFLSWMDTNQSRPDINLPDHLATEMKDRSEQILQAAPTPRAREAMNVELSRLGVSLFDQALKVEARKKMDQAVSDINTLLSNAEDMIASTSDPNVLYEQQSRIGAVVSQAVDTGKITPAMATSFTDSVNNMAASAAEHIAINDPTMARKIIDKAKGVSLQRRTSVEAHIDRVVKTRQSMDKVDQERLLRANVSQIENLGSTNEMFNIEAFGAVMGLEAKEEAKVKIQEAEFMFSVKSQLEAKSESEITDVIAKFAPKEGDKLFDIKMQVLAKAQVYAAHQVEMIKKDPAGYSMQDPVVMSFWDKVSKAPTEQKPGFVRQAIDASLSFQDSIGIPKGSRRVVPRRQAEMLAEQLNQGDPASVENGINMVKSTYGRYYPDVIRDMSRLPESQRIDPSIQVAVFHMNKPWLKEFIEASRFDESKYDFTSQQKTEFGQEVTENEDLNKFRMSILSTDPSQVDYVGGFTDAIRKDAMSLFARGKAKNPTKAVQMATDRILNDEYAFGESQSKFSGGSLDAVYAIRRKYYDESGIRINRTDDEINSIEDGLNLALGRGIKGMKQGFEKDIGTLYVDPASVDPKDLYLPDNLSDAEKTEKVALAIKRMGFWATSPDDEGVTLFIPGLNETAEPLKTRDGEEIQRSFNDVYAIMRALESGTVSDMNKRFLEMYKLK